jgi:hypothetical protein
MNLLEQLHRKSWSRNPDRRRRFARVRSRPMLEWLEDRIVLSAYTVTSTAYSVLTSGTLAFEINAAITADDPAAVISFDLPNNSTIALIASDVSANTAFGPTAYVVSGSGVNITIDGSGASGLTIDGGDAVRLFAVGSTSTLTLENITLTDGRAQGGDGGDDLQNGGAGGGAAGLGGAIFVDGGMLNVVNSTLSNNTAQGGQGGIGIGVGTSDSGGGGGGSVGGNGGDFDAINDTAYGGGGAGVGGDGQNASAGGLGGENENGAQAADGADGTAGGGGGGSGGGISGGSGAALSSGGFGGGGGGGLGIPAEPFPFNSPAEPGGGPGGFGGGGGGSVNVAGGVGGFGGGGGGTQGSDEGAGGFGGGSGGSYDGGVGVGDGGGGGGMGGAIFVNAGSTVSITNSTFTGNTALGGVVGTSGSGQTAGSGLGGAVFVRNGTLMATFDTFSANTVTNGDSSGGDGSDVYVLGDAAVPTATLIDDILGQSTALTTDIDSSEINGGGAPTFTGSTNNVVSSDGAGGLPVGAIVYTGDPLLGALASNGGPTQTMALQAGSPAIGAGITTDFPGTSTAISTDQRGDARPAMPDIGAYNTITQGPATLPLATVNDIYSQQLTASGDSGSGYTFAATGLPPGLSLSPSGLLSGIPTSAAGSPFTLVVTATDGDGGTGTQDYTMTVDPALILSPETLPVLPTVGNSYSQQFSATGGSGSNYSFTATGLPAGLMLSPDGLLSGTPTSAAPFIMVVTTTDGNGGTGTQTYTSTVDPALVLSPSTLPTPTVGNFYSEQLSASGGSGSGYVFTTGTLPAGLTLNDSGLLSGTPTSASGVVVTVDVTVTDSDGGTGSLSYALTVKEASRAGTIVATPAQTFYGQNVVLTATFSATAAGSAPMTGTVAFYDGTTYLGSAPLNDTGDPTGTSSLSTSALPVGADALTAVYSGDVNYSSATVASPATVQVAPATTSTTLSSSTTAQGTILTADVVVTSPGNPPIAGTVSFYDGTTLLGTEPVTNGVASLNIGALSTGAHTFSAVFSGGGTLSTSGSTLVVSVVSTDGPKVMSVLRYGYHAQSTFLVINFNSALAISTAEDAANYTIVGPAGRRIKVSSAVYDAATNTVMLKPAERLNIHRTYRLTVNGTTDPGLSNPSGTLLDGAGNGQPGSNYVTSLTWRNLAGRANQRPTLARVDARAKSLVVRVKLALHRHTK